MMKIATLGVVLLFGLALMGAGLRSLAQPDTPTWAEMEQQRLALEKQEQDLLHAQQDYARWQGFLDKIEPAGVLLVYLVVVGGTVLVFGAAWQRRHPLVTFSIDHPVVARHHLVRSEQVTLDTLRVKAIDVGRPLVSQVPHSLTMSNTRTVDGTVREVVADAVAALPAPDAVQQFAQVLAQGLFAPSGRVLMGHSAQGEPVWKPLGDLFSALVPGGSGSGKTWTLVEMICWILVNGGECWLVDPHRGDEQSLTARLGPLLDFMTPVEVNGETITSATEPDEVQAMLESYQARLHARRSQADPERHLLVLVVDECAAIMDPRDVWGPTCAPLLAHILESTGNQYRKYRCVTFCATQNVKGTRMGGTETRAAFNTRLIHNMPPEQLKMLPLDDEQREAVSEFGRSWYLYKPNIGDDLVVRALDITPSDVVAVASVIADLTRHRAASGAASEAATPPATPDKARVAESSQSSENDPPENAAIPSARADAVFFTLRREKTLARVVAALWHVTSKQGQKYQDHLEIANGCLDEYLALLEGTQPDPELQRKRAALEAKWRLDEVEAQLGADQETRLLDKQVKIG